MGDYDAEGGIPVRGGRARPLHGRFAIVLVAASALPVTRHRLTYAFLGGARALEPVLHHLVGGALGARNRSFHDGPSAELLFLHLTLDGPATSNSRSPPSSSSGSR